MTSRPTGTVSFLFTDVAGSTRLWDSDREGMASSLAAHDRILTGAIAAHGGYVFSTAGDSFGAAFPTAAAAVAAAIEIQLALRHEPWAGPEIRVRVGIHTGSSQERAGNYFGPDVNRAARVMSAGGGGQTLVSGATAELLGTVADPLTLVDRGIHRLKDLDRPEHLYELRHPDLPEVTEPLHTLDVRQVHLPARLTSFVGREAEVSTVGSMLDNARLVTLTGAGGAGKTSLAMAVGESRGEVHADGVWMVELAPLEDGRLVEAEVAELWGLRPGDGIELIDVITGHLAGRDLLLIVDNCEHLREAVAMVVSAILGGAPGVAVLATSRESLGVPGESVFRVPSLALPGDGVDAPGSEAVRLFLDRASRVQPGFAPSPEDLAAIVRICRRLDGIPLGIELAAARLRALTPTELADRLEDSLRILSAGSKAPEARQRTLEAAIDWSYESLDEHEAALFRRLSVFAGGFDLAAAEAVGVAAGVEDWEVLDLVDRLVDKSLVVAGPAGEGTRFRLLEPLRLYARERLDGANEGGDADLRHAHHVAGVIRRTEPTLRGPDQVEAVATLTRDLDNIRVALARLIAHGEADLALETCFRLLWFWVLASLQVEGRETTLGALAAVGHQASPEAAGRAWFTASALAVYLTDPRAVDHAARGLEVVGAGGDPTLAGWLSVQRAAAEANVGSGDAAPWLEEGVRLIGEGSEPLWDAEWDQAWLAFMHVFAGAGPTEESKSRLRQGMERALGRGDRFLAASALLSASYFPDEEDDPWVVDDLSRSVAMLRDIGARHALGHGLFYLGERSLRAGRGDGLDELEEASEILGDVGDVPCSTWSGVTLVRRLIDGGSHDAAGRHLAVLARRLLAFDGDVSSDLAAQACRLAAATGKAETAARLLGHVRAAGRGEGETLAGVEADLRAALPATELTRLTSEGAAAPQCTVLGWLADG